MAFPHLKFILGKWSQPFQGWWSGKLKGWISPWFAAPFGWRAYGLGIALGFIPCGLVYAALAAAIAGGGMITGALAMAAFAFGTMPSLIILGIGGQFALNRWRGAILQWAPLLLVFNAALLGFMAWQTIP